MKAVVSIVGKYTDTYTTSDEANLNYSYNRKRYSIIFMCCYNKRISKRISKSTRRNKTYTQKRNH